jgi:hypothetical protein
LVYVISVGKTRRPESDIDDNTVDGNQISLKTKEKLTEFIKVSPVLENLVNVEVEMTGLTPEREEIPLKKKSPSDRGGGPTCVYSCTPYLYH